MIFPTAWMNQLPLLDTIQFQHAFSLGANVTLLAANIRDDRLIMTGSGIYTPFSAIYHHAQRGDPEEGRLLVAMVPVLDPLGVGQTMATEEEEVRSESTSSTAADSGFCHQDSCFDDSPSPPVPPFSTFTSSMMYDPFKFVLLNATEGELNVCDGAFCCRLQYQRFKSSEELYALGAFAGTHIVNGRYAVQVGIENNLGYLKLFHMTLFTFLLSLCTGVCSSPLCRVGDQFLWTGSGKCRD